MYTTEQAKQALVKKQIDDMMKRLKLQQHKENVKRVAICGLPYKILKDCSNKHDGEITPNRFYPKCWRNIQPFNDWLCEAHPDMAAMFADSDQRMKFMFGNAMEISENAWTDEYKTLYAEYEKGQQSFNEDTPEGIQRRRYYMARFLSGYDLNTFSMFDFFGDTSHSNTEMQQFKVECEQLQQEFEARPEAFYTEYTPYPKAEDNGLLPPGIKKGE